MNERLKQKCDIFCPTRSFIQWEFKLSKTHKLWH